VGPQPKGLYFKGLCCQKRRPFLIAFNLCQVPAKFCVLKGKTGVNRGIKVLVFEIIFYAINLNKKMKNTYIKLA
jgi:hypothetical protein